MWVKRVVSKLRAQEKDRKYLRTFNIHLKCRISTLTQQLINDKLPSAVAQYTRSNIYIYIHKYILYTYYIYLYTFFFIESGWKIVAVTDGNEMDHHHRNINRKAN